MVDKKEFVIFEDSTQKATLAVVPKQNDYYELENKMISVETGEVQLLDTMELHKSELKALGEWIVANI